MSNSRLGKLFCALALFCGATVIASSAQTLTTLADLGGNPYFGSLIQATDGNFYGTTWFGGNTGNGTLFRVTPTGTVSLVYSFCKVKYVCSDGSLPLSVIQAADGNLYGTTLGGGAYSGGVLFQISKSGMYSTLYSFPYQSAPIAPLVQGVNGSLYGVSGNTIFQFAPATAAFTTVVTFPKTAIPESLVLSASGTFYGTTGAGGVNRDGFFFSLTPAGKVASLYNFNTATDGSARTLTVGADGNFYGTAQFSGADNGGTVFKITPAGQFTILHNFCSAASCADGEWPTGALVQATDGNFYGATPLGGTAGINSCVSHCGTAFQITPSGTLTTLYNFCSLDNCADGLQPYQGIVQGTDGSFYGATYGGGSANNGGGTLYSISMGLAPFVRPNPVFGRAGYTISISGTNLTGATSVTFNGTPATFGVIGPTLIKAQVPAGATSGTIQVTTPNGTLSSNVSFQITP